MRRLGYQRFFYLLCLFFLAWNCLSAQDLLGNCTPGVSTSVGESVDVVYMGNSNLPYSASASSRPGQINLIVYHYPYGSCDPVQSVRYGHTFDSGRGGFFGYHFYIAQDGRVFQGAPMSKRTNHVNSSASRVVVAYNNNTSIGITLICGEKGPTSQQVASAVKIGQALQVAYGVPNNRVFGHGEIQTTRGIGEGAPAQQHVRGGVPKPPFSLNYIVGTNKVLCVVDGPVPAGCTQNNCGYNFPIGTVQGGQPFNGNLHDARDTSNPTAQQDLPLLQKNYPQHLPDEFKKNDNKAIPEVPQLPNPKPSPDPQKIDSSNKESGPEGKNVLLDCSQSSISEKRSRVLYYYNQYQKSFKTKYGDWDKLMNSKAGILQKFNLEFVLAIFYSRQIRSNLEQIKRCMDVVDLKQ